MPWWMMKSIGSKKLSPTFSRKMKRLLCMYIPYLISMLTLLTCNNQMKVISSFSYISLLSLVQSHKIALAFVVDAYQNYDTF